MFLTKRTLGCILCLSDVVMHGTDSIRRRWKSLKLPWVLNYDSCNAIWWEWITGSDSFLLMESSPFLTLFNTMRALDCTLCFSHAAAHWTCSIKKSGWSYPMTLTLPWLKLSNGSVSHVILKAICCIRLRLPLRNCYALHVKALETIVLLTERERVSGLRVAGVEMKRTVARSPMLWSPLKRHWPSAANLLLFGSVARSNCVFKGQCPSVKYWSHGQFCNELFR